MKWVEVPIHNASTLFWVRAYEPEEPQQVTATSHPRNRRSAPRLRRSSGGTPQRPAGE